MVKLISIVFSFYRFGARIDSPIINPHIIIALIGEGIVKTQAKKNHIPTIPKLTMVGIHISFHFKILTNSLIARPMFFNAFLTPAQP